MGLLNRAQEIYGDKTFKNDVIVEGDLILKRHATMYAPIPGEPSLGTPHMLTYANRSTTSLVNTATNTAGTWSAAVTISAAPTGATAAYCGIDIAFLGVGIICVEKASGVTLDNITAGGAYKKYVCHRNDTGKDIVAMIWIPIDSNKQFKWCSFTNNTQVEIFPPVAYDI